MRKIPDNIWSVVLAIDELRITLTINHPQINSRLTNLQKFNEQLSANRPFAIQPFASFCF